MNDYLSQPVTSLKGVGKKSAEILAGKGIYSIYEILTHFPVFYIDKNNISDRIIPNVPSVYTIAIERVTIYRRFAKRFSVINIFGKIKKDDVHIRIFNKPYLFNTLNDRKTVTLFGPAYGENDRFIIDNPFILDSKSKTIVPVYKSIISIGSGKIERFIGEALSGIENISEFLPEVILKNRSFENLRVSLTKIHSPKKNDMNTLEKIMERFKYTEFLIFQLELNYIRKKISERPRKNFYRREVDIEDISENRIGFELTKDQKRSLNDIFDDMNGEYGMQRILMGEVGSGKTVVAFCMLLKALLNGFQGAILAPTGILTLQHYRKGVDFFRDFNIAILTGTTLAREREIILKKLEEGDIDLVFGTHSLLYERVKFKNLSAVVIDEQHRFGVAQRAALFYKGSNIDLLVTTATPIPRTLLLSIYKDLNLSSIKTLPSERKPVITRIIEPSKREDFYINLRDKVMNGAKGYIVVPLIERSENFIGLRSLEEELPFFDKIFKGIPTGTISGRSSDEEKNTVFDRFIKGEISVVISTTVIEVGVDVRDATFIVIEDADRFGLAQLHQLRGRVGRGFLQSYCYLIPRTQITESGKNRVKTIRETTDGFKIAEMDMKMRGGGLLQGFRQSGKLDFRLGDIKKDFKLFKLAEEDSIRILNRTDIQNEFISNLLKRTEKRLKSLNFS